MFKRHHHEWRAVAAKQSEYVIGGGDVTAILYHCDDCGVNKTETLNGHWTLSELQGKGNERKVTSRRLQSTD